jgi:hypothetical protein
MNALLTWLPSVDRVLIVGWRGTEQHFLADLRKLLHGVPPTHLVVGPSDEEYRAVRSNLHSVNLSLWSDAEGLGFSTYLASGKLDDLLR